MDKTAICNLALIEAEVDATISSVDTDTSIEAQRMRRIYDSTKRELLSSVNWGFATKTVALARVENPVDCAYEYSFLYPSGALRIVNVYEDNASLKDNSNAGLDYTEGTNIDGSLKLIFTDCETPIALIMVEVRDDILPPLFCKLLSLHLAFKTAKVSGASNDVKNRLYSEIAEFEARCKEFNANTTNIKMFDDADDNYYINVR